MRGNFPPSQAVSGNEEEFVAQSCADTSQADFAVIKWSREVERGGGELDDTVFARDEGSDAVY